MRRPAPGSQRGIALVLALWLLTLLAVIAGSQAYQVRVETRLAANHLDSARARALADGAVHRGIVELFNPNAEQQWAFDGRPYPLTEGEGPKVSASVRNAAGLVDLNAAPPELLAALFEILELDPPELVALVDAVQDWRDVDNLRHASGAEDDDYRRARVEYEARDRPFSSLEELRYVRGMSNERFLRVQPFLTLSSGQPRVNPLYAPAGLIALLAGIDLEEARAYVASRTVPRPGAPPIDLPPPGRPDYFGNVTATNYHIVGIATGPAGSVARQEAVVAVTPGGPFPYGLVSWRGQEGGSEEDGQEPDDQHARLGP
jgi:general secretion pathway protein K